MGSCSCKYNKQRKSRQSNKASCQNKTTDRSTFLFYGYKPYVKKQIQNFVNGQWSTSRYTHLKNIRNNIHEANPALLFPRADQVRLTRMRIGHTNVTHVHLVTKEAPKNAQTPTKITV